MVIIKEKYLIKEILNKYIRFYCCYGDNENAILFLGYTINKFKLVCKEWRNEIIFHLKFPQISITSKSDLGYVSEWIEQGLPINDIFFPYNQQTVFKDNFLYPQLTESIPVIADRIRSISFRSGKIDYGGTILLTKNTRSATFGVFNSKEYSKFCGVLANYLDVIKENLRDFTLTTVLYDRDIDIIDFKKSLEALESFRSLTFTSCFQNQFKSLDLIPQISKTLKKLKLLYINIEYETLVKMVTLFITNENESSVVKFEINAKLLDNHINGDDASDSSYDSNGGGIVWKENDSVIDVLKNNVQNWNYLDGLFELISNWKKLESFRIIMVDERVNISSILNFLGNVEKLKTFKFVAKLNNDLDDKDFIDNPIPISKLNKSVNKMLIKSTQETDIPFINKIWDHCINLEDLELHLDGDTPPLSTYNNTINNNNNNNESNSNNCFYKFKEKANVKLISLNHPYSNKLIDSIAFNYNIVSLAIIDEVKEMNSLIQVLLLNHPTIRTLNFNKSNSEPLAATTLIEPIIQNTVIEFLYINTLLSNDNEEDHYNNLELLISILKYNNTLIHLDYSFNILPNDMKDNSLQQLLLAIQSNKVLQSLTITGCLNQQSKQFKSIQNCLMETGKLISYADNPY
ncbi:hypothetical protein DICPUDRAFT_156521 [Dictyostelium purpureum]|uniref:Uncharacterized protein n=1 Tax=Dictyostelium purpureum TaxID=5786 RepID=F0ZWS8_DICPU|nr:uncharacterized protein DICPUDRAFT_156521 [Dictyostelium purpureum]EGC31608.1 hypothetical protein DICPUDRAFT_156521 [Dictyostelium purpureum]|eukprot:XP_003291866.1 hypothetical protein DICPUDRAFT_156521 [Dictyostelium purpureum]